MKESKKLAWAAGLYEGEGCCWTSSFSTASRKRQVTFGISITSTDLDVLERFNKIVGIGRINGPKNPGNRPGTRPVYQWMVQSRQGVETVILLLLPFMCKRRKQKFRQVLSILERNN